MKKALAFTLLMTALLTPLSAYAMTLNEAAQQAARQHNAKVLSAQTVTQGNQRVHVIKVLTKDGVVRTVRFSAGSANKKGG